MSLGYDTIKIRRVQHQLPPGEWQSSMQFSSGFNQRSSAVAVHKGVTFKWDQIRQHANVTSAVSLEASLPKLLWGHNVGDLSLRSDVEDALGKVADAAGSFFGRDEDISEWMLSRVDVTADRQLEGECACASALARLAAIPVRGKLPVRGQAGSISWPAKRGGFTRKAYSKFRETGLEEARGRLRVEVGAIGLRAVRRAFPGGSSLPGVVTVHLLADEAEGMKQTVTRKMLKLVDQVLEAEDMKAWQAYLKLKEGGRRTDTTARLLGYAWMMQKFGGWQFLEETAARKTVYNTRKEFERVGIDPLCIEFESDQEAAPFVEYVSKDRKEDGLGWEAQLALADLDDLEDQAGSSDVA